MLFNRLSRITKILIISDLFIIGAFGLMSPIFAVFIIQSIEGSTLEVVGLSWSIYLIGKSLVQIPSAFVMDKIKGLKDDFFVLFFASLIFSIVPIAYIFITLPIQLYVLQFIYGVATGITVPLWLTLFSNHLKKDSVAVQWGFYGTTVDLGSAGAAALGGFIATRFDFHNLFLIVSLVNLIGSMLLLLIYKDVVNQKKSESTVSSHIK